MIHRKKFDSIIKTNTKTQRRVACHSNTLLLDLGVTEVSKIDSTWAKSDSKSTWSRLGFAWT